MWCGRHVKHRSRAAVLVVVSRGLPLSGSGPCDLGGSSVVLGAFDVCSVTELASVESLLVWALPQRWGAAFLTTLFVALCHGRIEDMLNIS